MHGEIATMSKISRNDDLNLSQRTTLKTIMVEFEKLGSIGFGRTHMVEHIIDTGDALPIKQRQYPLSPPMQENLNKELNEMVEKGIVQKSSSPWCSPFLLVKKSLGSF